MDAKWAQIANAARADRDALVAGRAHVAPELAPLMERAIDLVDGRGELGEPVAQGVLSTLLLGRLRERLVAYWLDEGGPGYATACAAYERRYVASHLRKPGGIDLKVRFLAVRAPEQVAIALDIPTWQVLAPAFKKLRKIDRVAAQERVRPARAGLPLPLACYIDGIALLSEECAADVLEVAADGAQWDALHAQLVTMLPALALEPSEATREAAKAILSAPRVGLVNLVAPYTKAIVDALEEEDAVALLARILRDAHADSTASPAEAKKVARALAGFAAPLAEEFFATHVDSRLVGDVAADYVASKPTRATAIAQAKASAVHEQHERDRKERSVRAKKAARKRVTSGASARVLASAPVAEADAASIPWILREPPWRGALPPFPRFSLAPAPFEERVHWTEDEGREADEDDPVRALVRDGARAIDATLAMGDEGFQALRRVESPRVAERMLSLASGKRAQLATRYFVDYPEATTLGLASRLARGEGDPREILRALSRVVAAGHERAMIAALEACGAEAAAAAPELVAAARLMDCPEDAYPVPDFARPERLPPLLLREGGRLPERASRHLVEMLVFLEAGKPPYAGAALVRDALDRVALDRFLIALVEAAGNTEDDWAMLGLAALGGPDAMRAIVKRVKEWNASQSTRERALDALDTMVLGGRDAAAALTELLRKGTRGLVGERASHVLREIARREHLSEDELADMSTPSLDLASDGTVTLDFGPRTLRVVLGDDLSAIVVDEAGARVASVRALKTDDPVKARASLDRLKSLKKALGESARAAAARLEQSMVLSRVWEMAIFRDYVAHPLLGRVARRFVWARIDRRTGGVLATFRVSEDGSFADTNDSAVALGDDERVRVVHPMELAATNLARWSDVFADYEIIQPFPQLGRATFAPTREELVENALSRFRGKKALQMAIMGRLTSRGWEKVGDFSITGYVKRLRGVTAHYVLAQPMLPGPDFVNETEIGVASFGMPLGKVPPIAFSEVAYDLHVFEEQTVT